MKKTILSFVLILLISLIFGTVNVYAANDTGVDNIINAMQGTSAINAADTQTGIATTINNVIGLIQLTGTGISVIVVTLLGIKYLLASPSDKADVKKQIMPILIGCVLLFGAVNLVAIIADFSLVLDTGTAAGGTGP